MYFCSTSYPLESLLMLNCSRFILYEVFLANLVVRSPASVSPLFECTSALLGDLPSSWLFEVGFIFCKGYHQGFGYLIFRSSFISVFSSGYASYMMHLTEKRRKAARGFSDNFPRLFRLSSASVVSISAVPDRFFRSLGSVIVYI